MPSRSSTAKKIINADKGTLGLVFNLNLPFKAANDELQIKNIKIDLKNIGLDMANDENGLRDSIQDIALGGAGQTAALNAQDAIHSFGAETTEAANDEPEILPEAVNDEPANQAKQAAHPTGENAQANKPEASAEPSEAPQPHGRPAGARKRAPQAGQPVTTEEAGQTSEPQEQGEEEGVPSANQDRATTDGESLGDNPESDELQSLMNEVTKPEENSGPAKPARTGRKAPESAPSEISDQKPAEQSSQFTETPPNEMQSPISAATPESAKGGLQPGATPGAQMLPDQNAEERKRAEDLARDQRGGAPAEGGPQGEQPQGEQQAPDQQRTPYGFNPQQFLRNNGVEWDGKLDGDLAKTKSSEAAKKIGNELSHRIETGKFEGFFMALFLAVIDDFFIKIASALSAPTIVGPIILKTIHVTNAGIIWWIIWNQTGFFQRIIRKYFLKKLFVSFIASLIPLAGDIVPMSTLMILWIEFDAVKRLKLHKKAFKEWRNQTKHLFGKSADSSSKKFKRPSWLSKESPSEPKNNQPSAQPATAPA